jgi:hypothetical protein
MNYSSSTEQSVLVVDIGGTSVKILASGHKIYRSFPSGLKLTPHPLGSARGLYSVVMLRSARAWSNEFRHQ